VSDQAIHNLSIGVYLVASILFIIGLKRLSSPATARTGNQLAALGMLLAVVVTLLDREIVSYIWIIVGLVIGGAVGAYLARTVKMTAMPQMVAVFNGFGGGASALVAAAEFIRLAHAGDLPIDVNITGLISVIVGAVTLTGSFIAFGKLQGIVAQNPILVPMRHIVTIGLAVVTLGLSVWLIVQPVDPAMFGVVGAVAAILGVLLVIPIGGADMPVVVSLLNSYSGIAAAATGFVLGNDGLIIAGALVGASGLILTRIMTRAMNRSLTNVIFGGFGATATAGGAAVGERVYRSVTVEDAAMILGYSHSIVFVPGYGLAVAQAQHALKELAVLLQNRGADVKYAIHPVAGRMPGHMNVLLAEADVPYDELLDLEDANSELERADVAIVIGANDVTNPAARTDPGSPIYGMPILNVDKAKSVIVLKRSMSPGFAGIDNDLFYMEHTMMLFGDAKASVTSLVSEVRQLE